MKRILALSAVWSLVLYLGLFSGFALLHAYAENEIADAHGCPIGVWVQHATATESSAPPLATFVGCGEHIPAFHDAITESAELAVASRGPPHSSQ